MVLRAGLTVENAIKMRMEREKREEEHRKEIAAISKESMKEVEELMKELFPLDK